VLVSAGDFFQGTLIANQFQGAPVIDVLNHLHYDAVAVGNHEFDYGPLQYDLQHHPKTSTHGVPWRLECSKLDSRFFRATSSTA